MTMQHMTAEEIVHWIGELTAELGRRAQPAQQQPPALPWMQPPAPAPQVYRPPQPEPRARPFTQTVAPMANLAPMPAGGLPPGTPLTAPVVSAPADPMAAIMEQIRAIAAGQQTATAAPKPPSIVTATSKTDPEVARVFMGVPPRPDGVPPLNGSGRADGAVIVEAG